MTTDKHAVSQNIAMLIHGFAELRASIDPGAFERVAVRSAAVTGAAEISKRMIRLGRFTVRDVREGVEILKRDAIEPDEDGVLIEVPVDPGSPLGQAGVRLLVTTDPPKLAPWQHIDPVVVFLRALADACEAGEVEPSDVAQAITRSDGYNVGCPISEAQNESTGDVPNRLMAMLELLDGP